jgi:acetyltransferase-like isoleucine patch superfamily enzyme
LRKLNHPFYLFNLALKYETWYAKHFLEPQFDSIGEGNRFICPRHYDLVGPNIHLGSNNRLMALKDAPVRFSIWPDKAHQGEITIGDYCVVNPGVRITSASSITIGNNCMLAMYVYLMDMDGHDLYHRVFAPGNSAPIVLKDNVWVCDGAVIGKGITIGENSVVAARSIVTKNVPANVVVAGNPAKVIKQLDPDVDHLTRQKLYESGMANPNHEHEGMPELLKDNTTAGWLKSVFFPDKSH